MPRSSPTRPRTSSKPSAESARAPIAPDTQGPPAALDDAEFQGLIAALGPFERAPHLAVAVSGGPDSLALCLLADRWARARGGSVTALIVDHGLRPESGAEARQTAARLEQRAIRHQILCWSGRKPASGIQAAARAARHELLATWCRANGVLHLLLAHHRDDQAETVALRAARRSGPDGLAAMAPVREISGLRLLRPLLDVSKQRLVATLRSAGQPWIEDPSNLATRFARGWLRRQQDPDAGRSARAADIARTRAEMRAALDRRTAAWLADVARIDPAGFVVWPHAAFVAAPVEIARRALQQALAVIGGGDYPPRSVRLARLLDALRSDAGFTGRTLGGCRILRQRADMLICREPGAIAQPMPLQPGSWREWDRRFLVRWEVGGDDPGESGVTVRALGADGWRQYRARCRDLDASVGRPMPFAARIGLPSFWQGDRLLAVPALERNGAPPGDTPTYAARFRPRRPLAGPPFAAARAPYRRIARRHTFPSIWRQPMLR